MSQFKTGIFIGRFQPFHIGHFNCLENMAKTCDQIIILIGSSNVARSIKNPWRFNERVNKILNFLSSKKFNFTKELMFLPLNDHVYNDAAWIAEVKSIVHATAKHDVTLFGHMKDGNFYLKWFPEWKYHEIHSNDEIDATTIRTRMFNENSDELPKTVLADWNYFQKEKKRFENYPYPDTLNFNCSDVILQCLDKVLLIKRKFAPGAGSWALPGGFKNATETFLDCAIRELLEETNVRVPEKVLRGSIISKEMFDSPYRSLGIPRNTFVFHIKINPNDDGSLPRANGNDDAAECEWVDLNDILNGFPLHDDHGGIISKMLGVTPKILTM